MADKPNKLIVFQGKEIRRSLHEDEWYYSVVDIVAALTDSINPRDYWYKMKIRVQEEDGFEPSTVCRQLKMEALDGKKRNRIRFLKIKRLPGAGVKLPEMPEQKLKKNWAEALFRNRIFWIN